MLACRGAKIVRWPRAAGRVETPVEVPASDRLYVQRVSGEKIFLRRESASDAAISM